MSTTKTEFAAALRTAIKAVNVHGLKVVRADEVRAYGWPRSAPWAWFEAVAEVNVRTIAIGGEVWLVVPC